ncbi:MAG: calcium-binding protein [Pseudomonadota bacterium]
MATITGTSGNDTLTSAGNADIVDGLAGNDSLIGAGGNDTLLGGLGDDLLNGGLNADRIEGGDGIDTATYLASTVAVNINLETGVVSGGEAAGDVLISVENLIGSGLHDTLTGDAAGNQLFGGVGNDSLTGGLGDDVLNGGAGADVLAGGDGADTVAYTGSTAAVNVNLETQVVSGGEAAGDVLTSIENAIGSAFNDTLYGSVYENLITGGAGNDYVFADLGNDTIIGGAGADTFDGSQGTDTVIYSASAAAVNVNLTTGAGAGGDAASDVLSGVEYVTGSAFNDTITGDSSANLLIGAAGNDNLQGGTDEDTLMGGLGSDTLAGGDDIDMIDYSLAAAGIAVSLATGTGTAGEAAGDVISGVEQVFGSAFNDTITGNSVDNLLIAGSGSDVLAGGAGNDSIFGETGNDTVYGDAGADSLEGGDGFDVLSYASSAAAVQINLALKLHTGGDAEGDYIRDFEHVIGSAFNDVMTGDIFDRILSGGAGDDTLYGGTGIDTLIGGAGNDTYQIDSVDDVTDESTGSGTDLVLTAVTYTATAGIENMTLTSTLNVGLTGNTLNNLLTGNSGVFGSTSNRGNNALYGLDGNDTLIGFGGQDTLDGGAGNDSLVGGADGDVYVIDSTGDVIVELDGGGLDAVFSSITHTLGTYVEDLTLTGSANINGTGTAFSNILAGNSGANVLNGQAGNDTISANAGNDTLNGATGNDSMSGGLGDDVYYVDSTGDRTVEFFGEGLDKVFSDITLALSSNVEHLTLTGTANINGTGTNDSNILRGNTGANLLMGWGANDTLIADAGNDTLDGGLGIDQMTGGLGDDFYYVGEAADVVTEASAEGNDTVSTGLTITLGNNVEVLVQTGTNTINGTGNGSTNTLYGNGSANGLFGMAGNDTLYGGAGNDTLDGGVGTDSLIGGIGNDSYLIDSAADVIVEAAGEGTDTVIAALTHTLGANFENLTLTGTATYYGYGNAAANVITGNIAANRLEGGDGNDTLIGGEGNDSLIGGTGNDSLIGGLGDDQYTIDVLTDVLVEGVGGGMDLVLASMTYALGNYLENLTLTGGALNIDGTGNGEANLLTGNGGANRLLGGTNNDTLLGNAGNDTLDGGSGNDSMGGGAGNDTYVVDSVTDVVTEVSAQGTDLVQSYVTHTLAVNVENLTLLGAAGIGTGNAGLNVITGTSGNNILSGMAGADTLYGGLGLDTLDGGAGADLMEGGAGNDVYIVDAGSDVVVELLNEGTDRVQSAVSYTLTANVENLTLLAGAVNGTGNDLANALIGNADANLLRGQAGNDTLTGDAGNDTLNGGAGADSMLGGLGDDLYMVDDIGDRVQDTVGGGIDRIESSVSFTLVSGIESLVLTGTAAINAIGTLEADMLTGNSGANLLSGYSGNDTLTGNAGNDTLDGGAGGDSMAGGTGDDVYVWDSTLDVIVETATGGVDEVRTAYTYTLAANLERLVQTGQSNSNATGNELANRITANIGSNQLFGMDGNDTLDSGSGYDTMTGGTGADTFIFTALSSTIYDTITDFNAVEGGAAEGDLLAFTGLVGTFAYIGSAAFSGGSDNSEARIFGNSVLIDMNGDTVVDYNIRLTGLTTATQLTAADFSFF